MAMAKVPIGRILREARRRARGRAGRDQEAFVDRTARVIGVPLISVGRWFFGLALLGLGAEHFIFREFVIGRAPAWPDGHAVTLSWVYGSGVLVMLVGLAVLFRRWARPATLALGMLVFGWALLRHLPIVIAD